MSEHLVVDDSGSDDTIIFSTDSNKFPVNQNVDDSEVESIVNKYISETCALPQIDYSDHIPYKKSNQVDIHNKKEILSDSTFSEDKEENDEDELHILSEKYKVLNNNSFTDELNPLNERELKKLQRQQKSEERKRKKLELEREKSLKQVLAAANKNIKPGECMKFIHVHIDSDIVNDEFGSDIINALQASDIRYFVESQIFPNTISWSRENWSNFIDADGKLVTSSEDSNTNEILLIIKCKEFVEQIHNNSLISHIQSFKSVLVNKRLTLIIYGLENYMKFQKNQSQNEFAAAISNDGYQRQIKNNHLYQDFPKISMKDIEYTLTELQILCSCSHRLLNSSSEVALTVVQFSKAIAEIPYKRQKHNMYQQIDWFASGDNRDTVKIDKNGNGLQRLWKQMLTMFPHANLEIAEAIAAKYPTMTSLMQAYDTCCVEKPELLLQDIPIRRAVGPLSSTRRLGPELSKKLYNFFTSVDGDILI